MLNRTSSATVGWPAVIALNGPPQSGKTGISRYLQTLIPDAVRLQPSDELYEMGLAESLLPSARKGMLYQDYKRLPESRQELINASNVLRARDYNVFERKVCESEAYRNARVVIIDNVGHTESELQWYDRFSTVSILLRLDSPFNELEPMKAKARRLKAIWDHDSRAPQLHHTMLTAYDLRQMILLLDWLSKPLSVEEAGPYNGIKQLWDSYFAVPACLTSGTGTTNAESVRQPI